MKIEVQCVEGEVQPGVRFDLCEGPRAVAKATVLSVLEAVP